MRRGYRPDDSPYSRGLTVGALPIRRSRLKAGREKINLSQKVAESMIEGLRRSGRPGRPKAQEVIVAIDG
jgi:hypothetical protein